MTAKILSRFNNVDDAERAASRINKTFVIKSIRILFQNITNEKPLVFYKDKNYVLEEPRNNVFAFNGIYSKFYSSLTKKDLKENEYKSDTNPDFEMTNSKSCTLEIYADYNKIDNIEKILHNSGGYNITFSKI